MCLRWKGSPLEGDSIEFLGSMSSLRYNYPFSVDLAWLSQLSSLKHLDMSFVNLKTAVDWVHEINRLPNLKELHIRYSGLTNTVPTLRQFHLTTLNVLDISRNIFNSPIASNWFWNASSLIYLDITFCQFYGAIPDEIGKTTSLEQVSFQQNNLMSTMIPSSFKNLCNLKSLPLGPALPSWLKSQKGIKFLHMSNASITEIPDWFWVVFSRAKFLDLADNQISGTLPATLEFMAANNMDMTSRVGILSNTIMARADWRRYQHAIGGIIQLLGLVPWEAVGAITTSPTKGMQAKKLGGGCPSGPDDGAGEGRWHPGRGVVAAAVLVLGESCGTGAGGRAAASHVGRRRGEELAQDWVRVWLRKNPDEPGSRAPALESLDLSHNELSGEIPSSMSSLTSLSHMNLSYNNISGKIPTGNQFNTFDTSVYIGTIGLCGPPITGSCPGNSSGQDTHGNHRDLEDISLYLAMVIGFVLNLGMVFCVMLFKRSWRIAYFMFVDELHGKIYAAVVVRCAILKRKFGNN
ncbi:hypothetical protein SETIT_2G271400v2 [Setaria italica]|uniref:Leucine-rich repeat-containing N-terminal plant-type domain-containing protein n=1 Tax=Setaria italica TaxID=4555 RepID=A0A368Q3K9_SETIT|nr:hypothetical protein SETIT_2G271400v2 [Setaria italica]